MLSGKRVFWLLASVCLWAEWCLAVEILTHTVEHDGIRTLPASMNPWHSQRLSGPARVSSGDYIESGQDFFLHEYGFRCVFDRDILPELQGRCVPVGKVEGGALQFQTGEKGWTLSLGGDPQHPDVPSLFFGSHWGPQAMHQYRLTMDCQLEGAASTQWLFSLHDWRGTRSVKRFSVPGGSQPRFTVPLGVVNSLLTSSNIRGIQLQCLTPGVKGRIASLSIAPFTARSYWRKSFDLAFAPIRAMLSMEVTNGDFKLYVNGKNIVLRRHLKQYGIASYDITSQLRKGRNVIAVEKEFVLAWNRENELLLEGVAVGREGQLQRILTDGTWLTTIKAPPAGWSGAGVEAKGWSRPQARAVLIRQRNGELCCHGYKPVHMGRLQAVPQNQRYPVFDWNGEIAYDCSFPAGMEQSRLVLEVRNPEGDELLETVLPESSRVSGEFRHQVFKPRLRKTGAYQLRWLLFQGEREIERRLDEMVIAGPLVQDSYGLSEFEEVLQRRLRLVQEIDCSAEPGADTFFDRSGCYEKPQLNVGRVSRSHGMAYRETGTGIFAHYSYKLQVPRLGVPMLAEVVVPDDAERYVYACVSETYPVPFCNNSYPTGSRAYPNATGCVTTGGLYPLSKGPKTLRFIFFPGSFNQTITIQNGCAGTRAAACTIRTYVIDGGLPALKLPATDRLYGQHNERPLFAPWMAHCNALEMETNRQQSNDHLRAWSSAFEGIKRKIEFLRFQGHNASVEGIYMYHYGFPEPGLSQDCANGDFDLHYLIRKMYQHNGIGYFGGLEYIQSPDFLLEHSGGASDRRIRAGHAQGYYLMDRYGRQVKSPLGGGLNPLHPKVWGAIRRLMETIYQRYDGVGDPQGMFLVVGQWWQPCFSSANQDLDDEEIGYDDLTVSQFEKETGIALKISPADAMRFQRRYQLLMGRYRKEWLGWRAAKIQGLLQELQAIFRSGRQKLPLYVLPSSSHKRRNPFSMWNAPYQERDSYMKDMLEVLCHPMEQYAAKGESHPRLILPLRFPKRRQGDDELAYLGMATNRGTEQIMRMTDCLDYYEDGLNEVIGSRAAPVKQWYWNNLSVAVYDKRPAGEFAFGNLVNIIRNYAPKIIFNNWLDVNLVTGHGRESRRFLSGFYATPRVEFKPDQVNFSGIDAQVHGRYLRLVNVTPYPLHGTLACQGKFHDLVYDRVHDGAVDLTVKPCSTLVFKAAHAEPHFRGRFALPDDRRLSTESFVRSIVHDPALREKVPSHVLEKLSEALEAGGDAYRMLAVMNDFELRRYTDKLLKNKHCFDNQCRLLKELEEKGTVRIDCASAQEYRDEDGNLWLPDQRYFGFNTYGNEFGGYEQRGEITVKNTRAPRMHQTELSGTQVEYLIPLPNGRYQVELHIAETYPPNSVHGRTFEVSCNGRDKRTINSMVLCGEFRRAAVSTWPSVTVDRGMLIISLRKGIGVNGLQITRRK